jgi:DNA (cytosine-5)-methyltransferase 1
MSQPAKNKVKLIIEEEETPEIPKEKDSTKAYTCISLFSGLGGDSLGMTQAGCKVIAYNELKSTFCKSHDANFTNCELICDGKLSDISKLSDKCFERFHGKVDMLFAGFPCQSFSNAGKKKEDDPRNTMFLEFLRVTKLVNPYMIIGENVKGLLTKKTTQGELYIDVIVSEFKKIGYNVIYQIFKTHKFNIPQSRERLIILGIKNENPYNWIPEFPAEMSTKPNLKSIITYSMEGAVKVNPEWFTCIPNECIIKNMDDHTCYPDDNKGHPYLLSKLNANKENRFYSGKQHDNLFSFGKRNSPIHCEIVDIRQPCKTIICTYEHQPRLFVPIQNNSGCYLRMITPDELKQIQGFPCDYIICGTTKEQIIQIGNAVPPPLIKAIVEKIIS